MTRLQGFKTLGLGACTVLGALLLAGCASAPPRAERYVPPPAGSTWSYRVTSNGSFGSADKMVVTTRYSRVEFEGRPVLKFESGAGGTLQTDKVGVILSFDPAGRPQMRYDPPLGYEWPLEVGKTWTQQIQLTAGGRAPIPMTAKWQVEAYEDVTVPAGTYKAWRVSFTDNFGFKQTTWSVPVELGTFAKRLSERPAGHPQGAGTQVIELLTLPAVK